MIGSLLTPMKIAMHPSGKYPTKIMPTHSTLSSYHVQATCRPRAGHIQATCRPAIAYTCLWTETDFFLSKFSPNDYMLANHRCIKTQVYQEGNHMYITGILGGYPRYITGISGGKSQVYHRYITRKITCILQVYQEENHRYITGISGGNHTYITGISGGKSHVYHRCV